jgi:hypothetical protein
MFTSKVFANRFFLSVGLSAALLLMIGCGGNTLPNCVTQGLNVGPVTASVNHAATPPGNTQTFQSQVAACGTGATAALASSNWTASDPSVQLSPSPNTQVTATCTAAVINPVTITAVSADGRMLTGRATLTCN